MKLNKKIRVFLFRKYLIELNIKNFIHRIEILEFFFLNKN